MTTIRGSQRDKDAKKRKELKDNELLSRCVCKSVKPGFVGANVEV